MFPSLNDHSRYQLVNLDEGIGAISRGREVYRTIVRGSIQGLPATSFQNVIESVLDNAAFLNCDFSNTDFKDCVFKGSQFRGCAFDILTFATITLSDCDLVDCSFADSTFQNCTFQRVRFINCDFSKLLIKECQFVDCLFDRCKTSNKLLELSLLINTRFQSMDIQVDTILSNFGLCRTQLIDSRIRSGRPDVSFTFVAMEDLREAAKEVSVAVPGLVPVRLDFFERGNLLGESTGLDHALQMETWTQISSNLGSFVQVYRAFSDFLVLLYENDALYWQVLLKLHDLSGEFVASCKGLPFETTTTLMGIHQQLSIYVEEVLLLAEDVIVETNNHLELIVQGPTTLEKVQDILWPLFQGGEEARVTQLQPRNSPWQLGLDFLSNHHCFRAVVLLLATRVKAEIRKVEAARSKRRKGIASEKGRSGSPGAEPIFDVGFAGGSKSTSGYGISVLIPGRRVAELRLELDSKQLSRMAAFLVALDLAN
jgi:hypothetical protein